MDLYFYRENRDARDKRKNARLDLNYNRDTDLVLIIIIFRILNGTNQLSLTHIPKENPKF